MRKSIAIVAVIALATFSLVIAEKACVDKKNDKDTLQGTWYLSQIEVDGERHNIGDTDKAKQENGIFMTFQNDAVILTMASKPGEKTEWTYALDQESRPAKIDFVPRVSKNQDDRMTLLRIYKLDEEILVECYSHDPKKRPKEFSSKDGQTIATWKRTKS